MSKEINCISNLKLTKVMLSNDFQNKTERHFKTKLKFKNALLFFQIAVVFNLSEVYKLAKNYVEHCFAMIAESDNFLHLDYNCLSKILQSSYLNIHSEIEVFEASDKWLSYKMEDRKMFSKNVLSKVRLPLLSDHEINYFIKRSSSFSTNEECAEIMKCFLNSKHDSAKNYSYLHFSHRYCKQNKLSILIFGGYEFIGTNPVFVKKVTKIDGEKLQNQKTLTSIRTGRVFTKAVFLKGHVYLLGGSNSESTKTIEKYSLLDDCWSVVTDMYDNRRGYCVCSFINDIFLIGGKKEGCSLDFYLKFNAKCFDKNKWKRIAVANQKREYAACAVFEGKIVVSGGIGRGRGLNTVEHYDVIGDEWTRMAYMMNGTYKHSMVSLENKLFVIGKSPNKCEVYDSSCKRFVALKSGWFFNFGEAPKAAKVGNKIYVFAPAVFCYDLIEKRWSKISCEALSKLYEFSIVNIQAY